MIRSELVARIAGQNPHLYLKDVEAVVTAILDRVAEALANDDRVELRHFGTFSTKGLQGRTARNPKTGEAVTVAARRSIHFKPSKIMRVRLNRTRAEQEEAEQLRRAL